MFNDVIDDRRQEVAQRLARKRFQRQQEEVVQRLAQEEEVAQRLAQERFRQREEAPAPMEQPVTAMPAPTVAQAVAQAAAPQPAVVTTDEKKRLRKVAQARRSIGI
jgi:hypothetical protein